MEQLKIARTSAAAAAAAAQVPPPRSEGNGSTAARRRAASGSPPTNSGNAGGGGEGDDGMTGLSATGTGTEDAALALMGLERFGSKCVRRFAEGAVFA